MALENDGYLYDIFISYRNESDVQNWVINHFAPLLKKKLEVLMPTGWTKTYKCYFVDKEGIQDGEYWKSKLASTLIRSRILVSVLTPNYFDSNWCMSEWASFAKREELYRDNLNLSREQGLIFTVTYSDGKHFPEFAKEVQSQQNFSKYTSTLPAFSHSAGVLEFEAAVQSFAQILADILENINYWDENFPIEGQIKLPPAKINSIPKF
jgi:hypothetical protein